MKNTPTQAATDGAAPLSEQEATALLGLLNRAESVDNLTDAELSDAVLKEVWSAKLIFCSREDFLLSELLNRFDAKSGIKRDSETGEIVP